jgi:hypothetical protein
MKLIVLSDYRNRRLFYAAGERIEVSDEDGAFLMRDAPGVFAVPEPEPEPEPLAAAPDEPPADKAIKTVRRKG